MTEYRLAKPEEWEDCIELANYVFSMAHRPHDFEQLIPRVYQAGPEMARIHRVAVAENGRLRAEIAVLPQQMAAGGKPGRICGKRFRASKGKGRRPHEASSWRLDYGSGRNV